MTEWMIYLLKSGVVFAMLYVPFLFLKGDTFHRRNRYYLLSVPVVAAIIPLIQINTTVAQNETGLTGLLQTISVTPQKVSTQLLELSFMRELGIFILLVSLVLLAIRFYQLYYLNALIYLHKKKNPSSNLINMPGEKICFSALGYIFVSSDMNHPTVIQHESVHIQQKHAFDLLWYNLYTSIFWFNPFAWFAMRSIKAQHEYEADKICLRTTGNTNEYQALLLSSALGCDIHALTHSFSSPTLKNRFSMMTKKQSSKWTTLKTFTIVPLAVLAMATFSVACTTETTPRPVGNEVAGKTGDEITQPEFNGGNEAFVKYMQENIKYPAEAEKLKIEGKVYISFVVKSDGSITDAKILRSLQSDCDNEALRVIANMPKWKPGTKNGKPAEVTLTLPIAFKAK
ncbi:MAG: TonB family protein [Flavobacteriales bacterium]